MTEEVFKRNFNKVQLTSILYSNIFQYQKKCFSGCIFNYQTSKLITVVKGEQSTTV